MRRMTLLGALLMAGLPAHAKVTDPPPVVDGEVIYQSHANYVEATDRASGKLLWHTQLYATIEPERYQPGVEQDVQWNIIQSVEVNGGQLRVRDGKNRLYCLDKRSGKPEPC